MPEYVLGSQQDKSRVLAELQQQRQYHADYVRNTNPSTHFVNLAELVDSSDYQTLVDQPLLKYGVKVLSHRLKLYGDYQVPNYERVWVGVRSDAEQQAFGGFHHANQGYRYIQQVAILSVVGSLADFSINPTLASLELLRAYIHDTLHYNSYRVYRLLPYQLANRQTKDFNFYRFQYGINFRSWDGTSYSSKDPVSRSTTRNLGVIMEGATDQFAQELVLRLASHLAYTPSSSIIEQYVYQDCTGKLAQSEFRQLRDIEKGVAGTTLDHRFKDYLKSMRLFGQYVTNRYRNFVAEFDPGHLNGLHEQIIKSILSGKMKPLVQYFDSLSDRSSSFAQLFKSSDYTGFYTVRL